MPAATPRPDSDRNLVYGMLALQLNFVERETLIRAMHAWILEKQSPLGEILVREGRLTEKQRQALDTLLEQHLLLHRNDPQQSLHALAAQTPLSLSSDRVTIEDLEASISLAATAMQNTPPLADRSSAEPCRYRKFQFLARGGLGEVFVAKDLELNREVALKEIQPDRADDAASRKRFDLEAQITGHLEHPGVVPVYGLGAYPSGRPYYAMRLIRGLSFQKLIARFHSGERAGITDSNWKVTFRGLLGNFNDACNAVAYAHSRGVIHRDLKPENIMVGRFGETLVVDWGLAKAGLEQLAQGVDAHAATLDPPLSPSPGSDLFETLDGAAIGTPGYMSPEQAKGEHKQVGPASDIYSLGAILYILLTGVKPFTGKTKEEVIPKVIKGEFARPGQVKAGTPPGLEAVCLKAMASAPASRYQSALDLAAEVECWLADEPVQAFPESLPVRVGRWARRHQTSVVASAATVLCALVGLMIASALILKKEQETAKQKQMAEENYFLARKLSFSGFEIIEGAEPTIASVPKLSSSRKKLLEASVQAFRQYLALQPGNEELRFQTARVYRYAANVKRLEGACEDAETLYIDSVQAMEELINDYPEAMQYWDILAETLRDQASGRSRLGRLKAARDNLERSAKIAEQLRENNPTDTKYERTLATTLLDLSNLQLSCGDVEASQATSEKSCRMFRELPAPRHPYDPLLLASALNQAAIAHREAGRVSQAESKHAESIQILSDLLKKPQRDLNPADVQFFLAQSQIELGRTRAKDEKQSTGAIEILSKAASDCERLSTGFPAAPRYQQARGSALLVRARCRAGANDLTSSRKDYESAVEVFEKLLTRFPSEQENLGELGRCFAGLGNLSRKEGKPGDATQWFTRAIETLTKAVEPLSRRSPGKALAQGS